MVLDDEPEVWRCKQAIAQVGDPERMVVLDLECLERPPVILEGSSAVIWHLIEDGATPQDLVERVAGHYGVSRAEVEGPVLTFLDELSRLGLGGKR